MHDTADLRSAAQFDGPFVGRDTELRYLAAQLLDPESSGVLLAGMAGVGKSRLAAESMALADRAGLATMRVSATLASAEIPLGALAPLLPGDLIQETGRSNLLRHAARALVEAAEGKRLVLFIDDAHQLDGMSATLVHQLAGTPGVFILATVRSGERAPDPVTALWKDGLLERIDVKALPREVISELLSETLAGPVDPAAIVQLAARCEGNVMLLRELLLGAIDDGSLRDDGGIWRLIGDLEPSQRLIELVEQRLCSLTAEERDLLEVVSFGEPLDSEALEALADPRLAVRLEHKALLTSRLEGSRLQIRLAHPLYGDVLRARIPALRKREIARSLAEVLERARDLASADILQIGTLRLTSGGGDPSVLLEAARVARWRYDFRLSERLARAAVTAGAGFEARLLAAELASLQGRESEADKEFTALAPMAETDPQRGLLALARLDNSAFFMGRMEKALKLAEAAEASIEDPTWQAEITARRAGMVLSLQGPREAARIAEPLLEKTSGRALVWASLAAAYSLGLLGRAEDALAANALGQAEHESLTEPTPWYSWFQTFAKSWVLMLAGRMSEAEDIAEGEYQRAIADGSPEGQALFGLTIARSVADRGHAGAAIRMAREAAALFRQLGRGPFVHDALVHLAYGLALTGRADEAREVLDEIDRLELDQSLWNRVDHLQARAWTAVAAGDLVGARRLLREAAAIGQNTGHLTGRAAALHGLARLGAAREVREPLVSLARALDCDIVTVRAQHVAALWASDPEELDDSSRRFAALGADLLAAEAAADAAQAWRRADRTSRATRSERIAAALGRRCEGVATPALQAVSVRMWLTPAEREAATLAAAGLSNREIAAQLFLSVRTVETRLQRLYKRLGVSGRTELGSLLRSDSR